MIGCGFVLIRYFRRKVRPIGLEPSLHFRYWPVGQACLSSNLARLYLIEVVKILENTFWGVYIVRQKCHFNCNLYNNLPWGQARCAVVLAGARSGDPCADQCSRFQVAQWMSRHSVGYSQCGIGGRIPLRTLRVTGYGVGDGGLLKCYFGSSYGIPTVGWVYAVVDHWAGAVTWQLLVASQWCPFGFNMQMRSLTTLTWFWFGGLSQLGSRRLLRLVWRSCRRRTLGGERRLPGYRPTHRVIVKQYQSKSFLIQLRYALSKCETISKNSLLIQLESVDRCARRVGQFLPFALGLLPSSWRAQRER